MASRFLLRETQKPLLRRVPSSSRSIALAIIPRTSLPTYPEFDLSRIPIVPDIDASRTPITLYSIPSVPVDTTILDPSNFFPPKIPPRPRLLQFPVRFYKFNLPKVVPRIIDPNCTHLLDLPVDVENRPHLLPRSPSPPQIRKFVSTSPKPAAVSLESVRPKIRSHIAADPKFGISDIPTEQLEAQIAAEEARVAQNKAKLVRWVAEAGFFRRRKPVPLIKKHWRNPFKVGSRWSIPGEIPSRSQRKTTSGVKRPDSMTSEELAELERQQQISAPRIVKHHAAKPRSRIGFIESIRGTNEQTIIKPYIRPEERSAWSTEPSSTEEENIWSDLDLDEISLQHLVTQQREIEQADARRRALITERRARLQKIASTKASPEGLDELDVEIPEHNPEIIRDPTPRLLPEYKITDEFNESAARQPSEFAEHYDQPHPATYLPKRWFSTSARRLDSSPTSTPLPWPDHPASREFTTSVLDSFQHTSGMEPTLLPNLTITSSIPSIVSFHLPIEKQHTNRLAILHGGTIACMVDLGGSLAVASMGLFATGVSLDLNVTYLGSGGKVGEGIWGVAKCQRSEYLHVVG